MNPVLAATAFVICLASNAAAAGSSDRAAIAVANWAGTGQSMPAGGDMTTTADGTVTSDGHEEEIVVHGVKWNIRQ